MLKAATLKEKIRRPPSRREAIEVELQHILDSEFFRGSRRSCQFLHHIVTVTQSGRGGELKERNVGVELFGRDPSYDTGEDAIVRVKANEIRRRLAQYNSLAGAEQKVRIELPPGSYVPEFHWIKEAEVRQPGEWKRFRWWMAAAVICALAVLLFAGLWRRSSEPEAVEAFWRPVIGSPNPALICLGDPVVYLLSRSFQERYRARNGVKPEEGPYEMKFAPNEVLGADLVPVPDQFVGVGDAQAGYRIGSKLETLGKKTQFRTGYDVSFADLKLSPIVLVGAYSNRWTMQMTRNLRYRFVWLENNRKIVADRMSAGRFWAPPAMPTDGKVTEDYAIVSRIFHSESGQVLILAAGITQFGSQAAGEFLTDSRLLGEALRTAPRDWQRMNMQAVLKTRILGSTPGPAEVVATYFW